MLCDCMRKLSIEEQKKIQFGILQDIAAFCEKKHITYFLAYGTLIGAIRHNGYIPWDDDIDIAMPRPDYDRFVRIFNSEYEYTKVLEMSLSDKYGIPFAKAYDNRTWVDELHYKPDEYGVFVDIFPIDGIKGTLQFKKMDRLNKLLHIKKANYTRRSLLKIVRNFLGKIVLLPFSVHDILERMDKIARQYPFGTTPKAGLISVPYGMREIVDTSVFEQTIFHEFEGSQFRIPIGYDAWLKSLYGDYMQLPPEEKRIPHHVLDAYWKD